jgi:glycosyltransferase involved in cell wall biosynthesis
VTVSIPLKLSQLNSTFIHYPAQFWAHKNHYNLLVAFRNVLNEFPDLKLIFTGSDKGNKNYITSLIKEMKLNNSVIDLGFVSNEELKWLYLNSSGLVMPTLLGPTNMPLLEAAELNCPVACSNFPGHIEQLGDYGYYFNPESPEEIAQVLVKMLNENKDQKIKKYVSKFNISETIKQIDKSFSEIKQIRFTWGNNY